MNRWLSDVEEQSAVSGFAPWYSEARFNGSISTSLTIP
jgi:hypothetical protein